MIVEFQTSLALIHGMTGLKPKVVPDPYDRKPFKHVALAGLGALTQENKMLALYQKRVAELGEDYGIREILRWKPKKVCSLAKLTPVDVLIFSLQAKDLYASGLPLIAQQAIYAIIGGIAMQRGGQIANEIVKDRILTPLGLYQSSGGA